jgi:hypothetical protein
MSPSPTSPGAAPLPPLPDLSGVDSGAGPGGQQSSMASLLSGLAPIKGAVDSILAACKSIAQSGMVPGSEQVCGQIVALATSMLPMAAQQVLQPGGGGGGPVLPVGAPPGV